MMKSCEGISLVFWGAALIPLTASFSAARVAAPGQHQRVNQESAVVAQFQKQVADYVKLRKSAAAQLPALKPTASPAEILKYQHALANRIRTRRPHAAQGNIFTPPIAAEFRHLIQTAMRGHQAGRIRASMQRGAPVRTRVEVNHPYPKIAPVETTPPSLLLNLPKLPKDLEYRVVDHDLVLHDVKANLVVDFLTRAIP